MLNRRNLKIVALGFLAAAAGIWLRGQFLYHSPDRAEAEYTQVYLASHDAQGRERPGLSERERASAENAANISFRCRSERLAKLDAMTTISLLPLVPAALCGLVIFVTAPTKK